MPYDIERGHCPASRPWAVVKRSDGTVMGCHPSEEHAKKQLAALYANDPGVKALRSSSMSRSRLQVRQPKTVGAHVIRMERKATAQTGYNGLEHKSMLHQAPLGVSAETKMVDEEQGIVEAFVAVTGIVDRVNDIIEPGAIGPQLKHMWPVGAENHDWAKRVAKTLAAEEFMPGDSRLPHELRDGTPWPAEAGALWVRTQYNLDKESGRDAFSDVKFYADQQDWSIGYRATKSARGKDGIRRIKSMEIPEYSTVLTGANKQARTLSIKSDQGAALMEEAPRVIATFDDHIIVSSKGYGDGNDEAVVPDSWEAKMDALEASVELVLPDMDLEGEKAYAVPFTIVDGVIKMGDPSPVEVEVVDVPKSYETYDNKGALDATFDFVGFCQDEIKAGRKISGANMAKLKAALGSISEVVTLAEGVVDDGGTEDKGDNGMAKKPHDYAAGDGGKCATCGTANGNPMHHVGSKAQGPDKPESSAEASSEANADVTPHAYVDDGNGLCSVCGDPANAAQHNVATKADTPTPGDATDHAYVPGPFGKCKTCGKPESDSVHNVTAGKSDPGVGGGGPDAMTHEYVKGANGYCSVCGGTMKCAIHDGPFGQAYSGPIDGVANDTGSKSEPLNAIELMMMERERLAL